MFVVCFLLIKMQQFIYIFPNHVILQIDLISWFFISKIGIFMVCGIMDTEMVSSLNLAIVRLIPSSAIDPFSIQYFMIFSGALIVNHTALSSCFTLTSSLYRPHGLLPYDLRTFHWLPSLALG